MNHLLFPAILLFYLTTITPAFKNTFDHCSIEITGSKYACEGEEVTLSASPGFEKYYWSNGDTGQVTTVIAPSTEIRVVGVTLEGCVNSARFRVFKYNLNAGLLIGGFKYADTLWRDIYYYPPTSYPGLSYLWTLEGDTVGFDSVFYLDSLEVGDYALQAEVTTPCGDTKLFTGSISATTNNPQQSVTLCTPSPPYSYFGVPIPNPGIYRMQILDIWSNPVMALFDFGFSESYPESFDTLAICYSGTRYWGEEEITGIGSYETTWESHWDGCQTLAHLEVISFEETPMSITLVDTCAISDIGLDGEDYEESGLYVREYSSNDGCDSIDYLILNLEQQDVFELDTAICPGDTFLISDVGFSVPVEDYLIHIPVDNACDSLIALTLSYLDGPDKTEEYVICYGDSVSINGEIYDEDYSGFYTIPTQEGCDTLVHFFITEYAEIELTEVEITPDSGLGDGSIAIGLPGGRPFYDYLWSTGATENPYGGLSAGIYQLTVTNSLSCSETFSFEVELLDHIIDPGKDQFELSVFPNPVSNFLHVSWQETGGMIKITAINGRQIFQKETSRKAVDIDVSNWPPGVYFVIVLLNDGQVLRQQFALN